MITIRHYGSQAPVQAEGTVHGHVFFFHARWDQWSFSIALDPNVDVFGMSTSTGGFYRAGTYGPVGGYEASYMPEAVTEALIWDCCQQFIAHHRAPPLPDYASQSITSLTGRWLGTTHGSELPIHAWAIQHHGRFLAIHAGWQTTPADLAVRWYGKILPEQHTFDLYTHLGTFQADITSDHQFTLQKFVAESDHRTDTRRYWHALKTWSEGTLRADVHFRRNG